MLFADLADLIGELSGKGAATVLGLVIGGMATWLITRLRRHRDRLSILAGDARDTVVIHQHIIETTAADIPGGKRAAVLRIRCLGQGEMTRVIPNGHLAMVLVERAKKVTAKDTLISMKDAEGSFLLETLTGFVCDRVSHSPFEHELYVMAPCCEPQELAEHQPITIILISVADLALFENWPSFRDIQVEHGGDGARLLTLMVMAQRFKSEQTRLAELRKAGQRTKFVETMYILDLPLDRRAAAIPTKAVPWGRFENVLKQMNLE